MGSRKRKAVVLLSGGMGDQGEIKEGKGGCRDLGEKGKKGESDITVRKCRLWVFMR